MTISGKYELLSPVGAAGFRTFHARHVLTGQDVMVHFLQPGQRYDPQPAGSERSGAPGNVGARTQILDAGTYEGTAYLITYPVDDFTTLSAWLESVAPVSRSGVTPIRQPAAAPPPPLADRTADRKAEIAAAFRDVSPRTMVQRPAPGGQRPDSGSFTAQFGQPVAPAPPRDAGEFTQMFGGQAASQPASDPTPKPPPAPAAPPHGSPPPAGESFTQVFGSPAPPLRPDRAVDPRGPAQKLQDSGEFARVFLPPDRGPLPSAPAELARPGAAPAAPAGSSQQAGEFTLLFSGLAEAAPAANRPTPAPQKPVQAPTSWPAQRAGDPWQAPPPPPPQAPPRQAAFASASSFEGATQVFRGPGQMSQSAPAPLPMSPAGPGEFTMIMRGGDSPGGGGSMPLPSPQGAPAPPAGSGSALPGMALQNPGLSAPRVSMPSVTGPSVSGSGITPPSMQGPYLQAPQMSAPRLDVQMPSGAASPSTAAPAAGAGGGAISPLLAAVLSCIATAALLLIVYVLIKR